jgi:hypothetical protein
MHDGLLRQQLLFRFFVKRIGNAAIYRTNGSALGFFVKALALGAFVGNNVIHLIRNGSVPLISVVLFSINKGEHSC